jgi:Uma2 family endonuclease
MAITARKLTYSDLLRLPDDGNRHEIVGGEEVVTAAPNISHQRAVFRLGRLLADHVESKRLGEVLLAPVDVVLSKHDIVEPDLVFVSQKRTSLIRANRIQGVPDLVIEVSSPSTAALDRGRKRDLYERSGVREYWIVDLFAQIVEVQEFGRARRIQIHREGRTFRSAVLPGFALDVEALFQAAR